MVTDSMAGHYIWLTRGDSKVRASHAARDAKMFSWNKPPQGGHPGQEYNCRCRAIPVTAEHQLPIPAQNPDNPLRYRDLVESGLITKFNTMAEDRNRFLDADNAADIHEQRKQEGTRFKPGTTGMVLARAVNARDDAARSGADFEEAVRAKVSLRKNKPSQEETLPPGQEIPDSSERQEIRNMVKKEIQKFKEAEFTDRLELPEREELLKFIDQQEIPRTQVAWLFDLLDDAKEKKLIREEKLEKYATEVLKLSEGKTFKTKELEKADDEHKKAYEVLQDSAMKLGKEAQKTQLKGIMRLFKLPRK